MQAIGIATLFTGQQLIRLESVDSTNTYAKELLANFKPLAEGTVILAEKQHSGRGQGENRWISDSGQNLTFSLVLYPVFLQPARQFSLSKTIALAISDFLQRETVQKVCIKWPNDLFVNDHKVGGILIENSISGNLIRYSIIGIGLNINQTDFGTLPQAASLKSLTGKTFDRDQCLARLCESIEARYLQLRANHTSQLDRDYLDRLYRLGETHLYKTSAGLIKGTITGVSETGKLCLDTASGTTEFDLKEIAYL